MIVKKTPVCVASHNEYTGFYTNVYRDMQAVVGVRYATSENIIVYIITETMKF
jgi:hypothetical protein